MKHISSDLFMHDSVSISMAPRYIADIDTTLYYIDEHANVLKESLYAQDGFTLPWIELGGSFNDYHSKREVHPKVDKAISLLVSQIQASLQFEEARDYEHAHILATDRLARDHNEIGHIVFSEWNDENKYVLSSSDKDVNFNFTNRSVIIPELYENDLLLFFPKADKFGILATGNPDDKFAIGALYPQAVVGYKVKHLCGAKNVKCECGAEVAHTTHAKWCPKYF